MIIGHQDENYACKRCITHILEEATYRNIKKENLYAYLWFTLRVLHKVGLLKKLKVDTSYKHFSLTSSRVDLHHLFNCVSFSKTPWITTFESFVPRYSELLVNIGDGRIAFPATGNLVKAMQALAADSCRKIIALSECTRNMQEDLIQLFPEYAEPIRRKLCCLYPPQRLYVDSFAAKRLSLDGPISFLFVGRDFFTKGGAELIKAFVRLVEEFHLPILLRIVSLLDAGNYANLVSRAEIAAVQKTIDEAPWIEYHRELPNQDVIDLMLQSHVGILPSWAETFGYSVLEFQATGCPVITTDVRAFPEINSNEVGYLIEVPKNDHGEGLYMTKPQRDVMARIIQQGIETAVGKIFLDRSEVASKGERAIARVRKWHDPAAYAETMRGIYHEALR
ncbi:glycosyltransferase family 4 protein [Geomesophilobacter sediminis]|uniref:Glycosyltransferase family 4 protein n=1 Tax=Geomesophilobacter sediminis TaxID=2798584 RepID=A0A8J7JC44_9BACT|nr:glycosyltransferase family 4 protein [Geomesophilobacter sediminis]MBJ6724268.1 glycosyltransferase family 4 protein [Geomesophilobacter sediminis]